MLLAPLTFTFFGARRLGSLTLAGVSLFIVSLSICVSRRPCLLAKVSSANAFNTSRRRGCAAADFISS